MLALEGNGVHPTWLTGTLAGPLPPASTNFRAISLDERTAQERSTELS